MTPAGLEPATYPLGGDCSIQLSHGAKFSPSYGSEHGSRKAAFSLTVCLSIFFRPRTLRLGGGCSIQLSHGAVTGFVAGNHMCCKTHAERLRWGGKGLGNSPLLSLTMNVEKIKRVSH